MRTPPAAQTRHCRLKPQVGQWKSIPFQLHKKQYYQPSNRAIHFSVQGAHGLSLRKAYDDDLDDLDAGDEIFFPKDVGTKVRYFCHIHGRNSFVGQKYATYTKEKHTLKYNRRKVAKQIAEWALSGIEQGRGMDCFGTNDLADLYLMQLTHVSKATYQVILRGNSDANDEQVVGSTESHPPEPHASYGAVDDIAHSPTATSNGDFPGHAIARTSMTTFHSLSSVSDRGLALGPETVSYINHRQSLLNDPSTSLYSTGTEASRTDSTFVSAITPFDVHTSAYYPTSETGHFSVPSSPTGADYTTGFADKYAASTWILFP